MSDHMLEVQLENMKDRFANLCMEHNKLLAEYGQLKEQTTKNIVQSHKDMEEVNKLRADLDLAIEALKFYASGEHLEADDFDTETLDQGDFDLHENTHGKLARETLAKLQGENK